MKRLQRDDILKGFERLSALLAESGESVELAILGGASMVLVMHERPSTQDVDFTPVRLENPKPLRLAAQQVAQEMGLPSDWLNDGAKAYVHGLSLGPVVFESTFLKVYSLAPAQLLAMKLSAWRDDLDISDAAALMKRITGTKQIVWDLVAPHLVPGRELKAKYAYDDLWEYLHDESHPDG